MFGHFYISLSDRRIGTRAALAAGSSPPKTPIITANTNPIAIVASETWNWNANAVKPFPVILIE